MIMCSVEIDVSIVVITSVLSLKAHSKTTFVVVKHIVYHDEDSRRSQREYIHLNHTTERKVIII